MSNLGEDIPVNSWWLYEDMYLACQRPKWEDRMKKLFGSDSHKIITPSTPNKKEPKEDV